MNKKVLTLCAGLLLAGSTYAVDYNSYAKVESVNSTEVTVVNGQDAYQLKTSDDKLLAMQRASNGEISLQLVDAVGADLMETLWTVSMKDDGEGGISYTFYNKAYGLPLAFNSADAKYNGANATVATGNVNEWKWRTGAGIPGLTQMYSNFHPDSALVLVNGANGVEAKKVNTKNTPVSSFGGIILGAYEAKSVVLTADALNSMLGLQNPAEPTSRMQLGFTRDQLNGVDNLWLKDYRATKAFAYNDPISQVAQAALEAAKRATSPEAIVDAINASIEEPSEAEQAVISAVAAAAQEAIAEEDATISSVQTAVEAEVAKYTEARAVAVWMADYAEQLADAIINGNVTDKTSYDNALDAVQKKFSTSTSEREAAKAACLQAFKDLMKEGESVPRASELSNLANQYTAQAENAQDNENIAKNVVTAAQAAVPTDVEEAISAALDKVPTNSQEETGVITELKGAISGKTTVDDAIEALETKIASDYPATDNSEYVSLISVQNTSDASKNTYLRVDTAYLENTGDEYKLAFAIGTHNANLKDGDVSVASYVQNDFNGRYNFKFTYYPTQDSLMIEPQSNVYPFTNKAYTALTNAEVVARNHENEYVKLAILATDHREVTVGVVDKTNTTPSLETINTRIYLNGDNGYTRTTLPSGVYHFSLVSAEDTKNNGKYFVAPYCGQGEEEWVNPENTQNFGTAQDFNHIPRTQWVVEQLEGVPGEQTVKITNREFPSFSYNNVQLYKDADGNVFARYLFAANDTLKAAKIDKKYTSDPYLGYKHFATAEDYEKFYNLDYLSGIALGNYVNMAADSAVYVDLKGNKSYIEFVPVTTETNYGYTSTAAGAVQLKRVAYNLRLSDAALLTKSDLFIVESEDGKSYEIASLSGNADPVEFVLKENNQLISEEGDTTCYYALQAVNTYTEDKVTYVAEDTYYNHGVYNERVGVRDASMEFSTEDACSSSNEEVRVATFAVVEDNTPLYRRLGVSNPEDGFRDSTTVVGKIYRVNSTNREYLYEDATSVYSAGKGINFLGVEGKGDAKNAALYVDTAYIRNNTNMPQYMFAVDVTEVPEGMWCPDNEEHNSPEYIAVHGDCGHKVPTQAYKTGRYLINAEDSVQLAENGKDYIWNAKYTRLAFVEAKHIGDTLIIMHDGKPGTLPTDSIFLGDNLHNINVADGVAIPSGANAIHSAHKYGIKNPVFALRLVNTDDCDFLIESVGDHKIPSEGTGKWVAVKNGVPVVASYQTYTDAIADAEIFNIEPTNESATANEEISAENAAVSVVATDGGVIIRGAAGKNVVIATILGKVVANETVNSDNETISVPAGIVVVSVDGESFKVVVK